VKKPRLPSGQRADFLIAAIVAVIVIVSTMWHAGGIAAVGPKAYLMMGVGVVALAFRRAAPEGHAVAEFGIGHRPDVFRFLGVLAWVLVVVIAGEVTRYHSAYLDEARRRVAEAQRTREEEALRRATEERLRIARELHDVLAHKISLINVQASAP
jgi:signal transduction histidine kinase